MAHVIHQRAIVTATAAARTLLAAAAAQSRASGHLHISSAAAACFVANQSKKAHDQQSINLARPGKRYLLLLCLSACSCAPTPCLVRDTNVRGRPFVILEAGEFDLGRVHSSRWVAVLLPRCSSWDAASPAPLCSLWVHRAGV